MLELIPQNWFSWKFDIIEDGEHVAGISPALFRETASVEVNGVACTFYREKMLSGSFVLEVDGARLVEAQKVNALSKRFDILIGDQQFLLRPNSWISRQYILEREGKEVGSIQTRNWISRMAVIDLPEELPLGVKVFITWLVILMWKRDAAAAGGG